MGTATLITVAEYLHTTYRPDCDFVGGEVRERNAGEGPHADLQGYFYRLLWNNRLAWGVYPRVEQRVQVAPERYRIPDVCALRATDPRPAIVTIPPLLCIEVMSSGQNLRDMQERADDHYQMGVEHVWVIDPLRRLAYDCMARGFHRSEDGYLRIAGSPIEVELDEAFAELDA